MRRLLSALAISSGLVLALGACAEVPLTGVEVHQATLTPENLGDSFQARPTGESLTDGLGCLERLPDLGADLPSGMPDPASQHTSEYVATAGIGLPAVLSSVASFRTVNQAKKALKVLGERAQNCPRVSADVKGVRTDLQVSTKQGPTPEDADEVLHVNATGTTTSGDGTLPMGLWIVVQRHEENVSLTGYLAFGKDKGPVKAYAAAALQRMVRIAADKAPSSAEVDVS